MTVADQISTARALIDPLTGHTPGPWEVVTDLPAIAIAAGNHRVVQTPNQNNYRHFGRSEPWLGIGTFSNAALIAAAPALRDTVAALTDLADAQAQENERLRYVLEGVRGAIDTGRNEPLMIWRDQINIALGNAP